MEKKTKTVTIVGWGIGWLASAILLAKAWYKVSVYEKNECLGGRASILHKDGFTFDMGPSWYLMPDVFEEFFTSIGEDIHDWLDLKQLSPSYRVFYEDTWVKNQIEIVQYNGKICCNAIWLFWYNSTQENMRNGVLAVIKDTQTGKFLFQIKKRAYNVITLCGWGVEEWENYEDTIRREVKEETGLINPKIITKLWDSMYLRYRKWDKNLFGSNDFYYIEVESAMTDLVSQEEQYINWNIWLDENEVLKSISFYSHLIGWFRFLERRDKNKDYTRADKTFIQYCEEKNIIYIKNSLTHLDIYADSQHMSDTFESMESWAGKQFLTFLARSKEQYEIGMEFCKKNYDSIFDFFRWDIMRKGFKLNIWTTIDRYVARYFKNQIIQKIMQYTTIFLWTAPKQTPALYNIMSHCDFGMGVRYPQWGIHQIARVLHEVWLKYWVEYHLDAEVVWCEIEDNQIKSLKINTINTDKGLWSTSEELQTYTIVTPDQSRWEDYKEIRIDAVSKNPEAFGGTYEETITREDFYRKSRLESKTNTVIFVQDGNNRVIGTANYTISWTEAKIFGMYCKSEYRWKWIWSMLIQYIKQICTREWVTQINLRVYTTQDPAIKLYTKEWFVVISKWEEDDGKPYLEMSYNSKPVTIDSNIYLINADMAWFETSVLPTKSQTYPRSYRDSKIFAPSGFIIYAWVNKKLPNLDHHNLYFCEDRNKNFGQIFDIKELPTDPSIYVSKITHTDPSMAPEWCENLFILVPIPNGIEITDNQKQLYKDQIWKIVEKMAGEDIVWHILVEEVFTVSDFKSRYNSRNGTALWLAHPIMQTAVFRPNNISKKLDNLFYVWHNTNPGIGVPMVIISAQLALERIKKQFTIQ